MRGEISSGKYAKRHPLDWYVDEIWCARQLAMALGNFRRDRKDGLAFWDPCAGLGNTLQACWELGFQTFASDLVCNMDWTEFDASPELARPQFILRDFRDFQEAPAPCSIVFNPPYSYEKGILEALVRHALSLAKGRVCALVPNKWLSSQVRYDLFMTDHPPQAVLHLTQRPSMPPGDRIHLMGSRAFRGGMIDYCWMVWDVKNPTPAGDTRTIWLPPLGRILETHGGLS